MINRQLVSDILGHQFVPALEHWLTRHPRAVLGGGTFFCFKSDNGVHSFTSQPSMEPVFNINADPMNQGIPTINLLSVRNELPENCDFEMDLSNVHYSVRIPFKWFLSAHRPKYYCYNIAFGESIHQSKGLDKSFAPFFKGYVGITGRNPILRFSEHVRDVNSGKGYTLHSSWRSLGSVLPTVAPTFVLLARAKTLDEIYDIEEGYVEKYTLAPKGLNAIPGGKAGMRLMHLLRQKGHLPSIAERDAALCDLENGRSKAAAHYRKGHIRKLPSGYSKSETWVSPCWVNLTDEVTA